jgi:hypothetical protein
MNTTTWQPVDTFQGMGTSHCTHPAATRPAEDPDQMPSHMTTDRAISSQGPCAGGRLYERKGGGHA